MNQHLRQIVVFAVLLAAAIGLFLLDFTTGATQISLHDLFLYLTGNENSEVPAILIREFRLTRVLTAIIAGASLSVSGLLMQTIFRNPLAGPYVLGISSGAGLGVALLVMGASFFGMNAFQTGGGLMVVLAAAVGAGLVMMIIIAASLKMRDNITVLILGILLAAVISAVVNLLQYFADSFSVKSFVIWGMGSLTALSFNNLSILIVICIPLIMGTIYLCKPLNLFLLGEDYARVSGVKVHSLRIAVFVITCILAGSITAFCGPIGFIGIAVPHITRWIFKTQNHFVLIAGVVITGSIFMMAADIISHSFASTGVLPINSVTAITGIPVIVYIVMKNQKNYF